MKRLITVSIVTSGLLMAAGYKLPEHSLNSTALAGAYTANTSGADTAYANPANMAFMENKTYMEGGLMLVHLPPNKFTSFDANPAFPGESETENIPVPSGHYVAPANGDFRWGVSMVSPGGLTKRWETTFQRASAEKFALRVVELNPSFSYKLADSFSIGGGIRLIYSDGIVRADAAAIGGDVLDLEGDTFGLGYNLALAYRPTTDIKVGVTYRSNIDLKEEGTATILNSALVPQYIGPASVTVPLPATLNIAIAKNLSDKLALELNYERVYWSKYKDFQVVSPLVPVLLIDVPKNWKDTNTFRIGATYKYDEQLTLMAGFAIDENPVPDANIGFELPDSDAKIYSLGFRYQQTDNLSWGMAVLYDDKESRTVQPGVAFGNPILPFGGEFTDGGAFLTMIGMAYEF